MLKTIGLTAAQHHAIAAALRRALTAPAPQLQSIPFYHGESAQPWGGSGETLDEIGRRLTARHQRRQQAAAGDGPSRERE